MSYKFDRGRFPPTIGQAFPSGNASGIKHSAGGLLLPDSMPSRRCRPRLRFYLCVLQLLRLLPCFVGGQGGVDGVGAEDYAVCQDEQDKGGKHFYFVGEKGYVAETSEVADDFHVCRKHRQEKQDDDDAQCAGEESYQKAGIGTAFLFLLDMFEDFHLVKLGREVVDEKVIVIELLYCGSG